MLEDVLQSRLTSKLLVSTDSFTTNTNGDVTIPYFMWWSAALTVAPLTIPLPWGCQRCAIDLQRLWLLDASNQCRYVAAQTDSPTRNILMTESPSHTHANWSCSSLLQAVVSTSHHAPYKHNLTVKLYETRMITCFFVPTDMKQLRSISPVISPVAQAAQWLNYTSLWKNSMKTMFVMLTRVHSLWNQATVHRNTHVSRIRCTYTGSWHVSLAGNVPQFQQQQKIFLHIFSDSKMFHWMKIKKIFLFLRTESRSSAHHNTSTTVSTQLK